MTRLRSRTGRRSKNATVDSGNAPLVVQPDKALTTNGRHALTSEGTVADEERPGPTKGLFRGLSAVEASTVQNDGADHAIQSKEVDETEDEHKDVSEDGHNTGGALLYGNQGGGVRTTQDSENSGRKIGTLNYRLQDTLTDPDTADDESPAQPAPGGIRFKSDSARAPHNGLRG